MEPTLRPAQPEDLPSLLEMRAALCAEDGSYPFDETRTEGALRELLRSPHLGEVWLAAAGDPVIAYLVLTWGFSLEFRGRDAFVDELFVRPAARGTGLGSRLLALAEERCRRLGIAALHLEVELGNPRAHALYCRVGYREHSRHFMTKWLEDPPRRT